jgi:hypothetical protein
MKTGIELIEIERNEQIEKHGRIIASDVRNNPEFQLAAAASYLCNPHTDPEDYDMQYYLPVGWDLDIFTKMCYKPYKERLIIAGALIAAEIDRLQYK